MFSHLGDLSPALQRENTPIVVVINDAQFVPGVTAFPELAELAAHWPNVRFAFVTDADVDPDMGGADGVVLLDATHLRSPLGALNELSLAEAPTRAHLLQDWAEQKDASGGLYRLLVHLAGFLSVPRYSVELDAVDDLDAVLEDLRQRGVVEVIDLPDGRFISLAPEVRDALDSESGARPDPDAIANHAEAARLAALLGDNAAMIFHLGRAGHDVKSLEALIDMPLLSLSSPATIAAARLAADTIDINSPSHSARSLARRLQIATLPPLESVHARDTFQDALTRALSRMPSPSSPGTRNRGDDRTS